MKESSNHISQKFIDVEDFNKDNVLESQSSHYHQNLSNDPNMRSTLTKSSAGKNSSLKVDNNSSTINITANKKRKKSSMSSVSSIQVKAKTNMVGVAIGNGSTTSNAVINSNTNSICGANEKPIKNLLSGHD